MVPKDTLRLFCAFHPQFFKIGRAQGVDARWHPLGSDN